MRRPPWASRLTRRLKPLIFRARLMTTTVELTVAEIHQLAHDVLIANGCDVDNAVAIATTVSTAERDGSESHGLFRIPGYVGSIKSGKVNGKANPTSETLTPAVIRMNGDNGYTPLAIERGVPLLAEAAKTFGIAAMPIINTFHFAALWPETEALALHGLVGMAFTAYKPKVAPAGAKEALFGTNPISVAWPRPGRAPWVFDMATSSRALGDIQIAARDGHAVPMDTGLDSNGNPTTDPSAIANGGVILPFGGHKGSAIATMVELFAAGLTGEQFSFEAGETDIEDGGPARGGELLIALSPTIISGGNPDAHCEPFFKRLESLDGVRLPGQRRHHNRKDEGTRSINAGLLKQILDLT